MRRWFSSLPLLLVALAAILFAGCRSNQATTATSTAPLSTTAVNTTSPPGNSATATTAISVTGTVTPTPSPGVTSTTATPSPGTMTTPPPTVTQTTVTASVTPTIRPTPTLSPLPPPAAYQVSIANFAFSPAALTIKAGDTVVWTNNDQVSHTVTGSGWGSGTLSPGQTFSQTFSGAGTFPYHGSIHTYMEGTVTVQ